MSPFWMGNLFLALSILCAAGSQVTLKALLNDTGPLALDWSSIPKLGQHGRALRLLAVLIMLIAGFLLWMLSLSRLDLSYAYTLACSSALVVTLFSVLFLKEPVLLRTWWGSALIVAGTILLAPGAGSR